MHAPLRRKALAGVVAACAATVALAPSASATPTSAAKLASDWLTTQLVGGNHFVTTYDYLGSIGSYDDVGSTLDGVFAMARTQQATGVSYTAYTGPMISWIKANSNTYLGGGTTNATTCATTGTLYAGAIAKYAIGVASTGGNPANPADTGGRNLIADLKCREQTSGRFSDTPNDYSVIFSQSLAILLFKQYGITYSNPNGSTITTAVNYLKSQQCTNTPYVGAFRSPEGLTAGSCTASDVDVDSTAVAADALYAAGETTAAGNAMTWLTSVGKPSAAAPTHWQSTACTGTAQDSVNSTAMAATAYATRGTTPALLANIEAWLESQADPTNHWLPGCASTNTAVANSNRVRATTQGVLGLLGTRFPV
jgi:hypothetical protein